MAPRSRFSFLALVAIAAAACSSDSITSRNAPFALGLTLSPAAVTIGVADTIAATDAVTLSLRATSFGSPVVTPTGIAWSSADPSIATVDAIGTVHAVHPGTTTVSARINEVTATTTVAIVNRVVRITITPPTITAVVGDTVLIAATALDASGAPVPGTDYGFTLADPTFGTVTPTGTGTARLVLARAGTVGLTVTGGGQAASTTGTVSARDFIGSASATPTGGLLLAAGDDATCGLLPLGRGYCFGRGTLLGVAKDTSCFNDLAGGGAVFACTLIPLRIAGALSLSSISVGETVACATTTNNNAYCWGSQSVGQLGNGIASAGSSLAPSLVVTNSAQSPAVFNRITAGGSHACGLTPANTAWCWGSDALFQLGNGDGFHVNSTTPIPVGGGASYSSISAGRNHTCAIRSDNAAVCWGDNGVGQLGTGGTNSASDGPISVAGPAFVSISAGASHTCALTASGVAWCWGSNDSGQVGRGLGAANTATPAPVAGGLTFRSISAGRFNTCGVTTAGAAACWGANQYGQIGDGTRGAIRDTPIAVVGGRTDFTAVTVGTRHVCATGASGAFCWGSNILGALGNGLQALIQTAPAKTATPQ